MSWSTTRDPRTRNAVRTVTIGCRSTTWLCAQDDRLDEILDVHEALERLGVQNAAAADVVELRYYGGYKLEEIAAILDVSLTTVKNKHEFAMSWLEAFLNGSALD